MIALMSGWIWIAAAAGQAGDEDLLREIRSYPHRIVIESRRDGNWDLFLMNADGSETVNLTRTPDVDELYPKASPDGSRICFVADEGEGKERSRNLYLIGIDGTGRKKLAENARDPCWSPDGTTIAYLKGKLSRYTRTVYATRGLYFYDVASGDHRRHANRKIEHLYTVDWSPDGKWLMATVHGAMEFRHAVIAIEADGDRVVDLKLPGCRPDVSPDGKNIAWGFGDYAIGLADLDFSTGVPRTSNIRKLISSRKPMETYHVDWSPDGRYVAFSYGPKPKKKKLRGGSPQHPGARAEGWNTCVADAAKMNRWVRITDGGRSNKEPDWVAVRNAFLDLKVLDEKGTALPCRILVRSAGGECVVPEGAVDLRLGPDRWFMSAGENRLDVPGGRVELRVERGLEYVPIRKHLDVRGPTPLTVTLRRWVDMKEKGYLSGENHLHEGSVRLAPLLVAEGLDFGTSLTWWNGPDARRPIPEGEGRIRILEFAGRKIPTSIYDAELEYAWGAAYIQNLPEPMSLAADKGRPNLDYLRRAVEGGAIVHYQGGWSREVVVDALLGYVHTLNVCNNNFSRHRYQPRSRYSNLLGVEGFPVYPGTDVGMMRMNTDTYYRLLNWGLRLAAGAGSATGVKEAPVGYNRAYVRVAEGAGLEEFNKAWAAGRNFVTNGPMIFLSASDGTRPGDTVALPAEGGVVRVSVELLSDVPLTSLDVVVNGKVVNVPIAADALTVGSQIDVPIKEGSWIAARCTARDPLLTDEELKVYSRGDANASFPIRPSRLRFAHTSPIYVTVGGKSAAVRASIEEGFKQLDAFAAFARKTASPEYLDSILKAVEKARGVLEARLDP